MDRYQENKENAPKLKPVEEAPKLQFYEIGIRSDVKGPDIKRIIDKVVNYLVYEKYEKIILKSRGKACSKLISIVDILRRKILGLYMIQRNYSTAYLCGNERDRERTIQLPCLDATLQLTKPNTTEGYFTPRSTTELDANYIDPNNPPQQERQEYRGGFRGRGRGGMVRGYYRGRGNFRGDNYRGGQYRGRGGQRGNYGGFNRKESDDNSYETRKYHQTNYHNYNNNNEHTNYNHNFNNSHYNNRNEVRGNMRQYNQEDNNQPQYRRNMNNKENFNNFDRGRGRGGRGQFYQHSNNRKNFQDEDDEDYVNFRNDDQSSQDNQPHYNRGRGNIDRGFAHYVRGGNDQRGGARQRGTDFGNRGGRFMMRGRGL